MFTEKSFLSVDWGTSSFRIRLVRRADVTVLAEHRSPQGIGQIAGTLPAGPEREKQFAGMLLAMIRALAEKSGESLRGLPVVISGMASSSLGWRMLPYAEAPFSLDGAGLRSEILAVPDADLAGFSGPIVLISGVKTGRDVMRGEETEILGLFRDPALRDYRSNALLIMPGTHSKHVHIRDGRVIDWVTCMTGELFDIVARQGVLRASLSEDLPLDLADARQQEAFLSGVREGVRGTLLHSLFRVRARDLLEQPGCAGNRAFLRGLLLGAEIFVLQERHPALPAVLVAAGKNWREPYRMAFAAAGIPAQTLPQDAVEFAAVRGHAAWLDHLA